MRLSVLIAFLLFAIQANAQKIKLKEGSIDALINDTSFNIEFTYDDMSVGKFDFEADYVSAKIAQINEKKPGAGDVWAKKWISDRATEYEPKFIELFTSFTGASIA